MIYSDLSDNDFVTDNRCPAFDTLPFFQIGLQTYFGQGAGGQEPPPPPPGMRPPKAPVKALKILPRPNGRSCGCGSGTGRAKAAAITAKRTRRTTNFMFKQISRLSRFVSELQTVRSDFDYRYELQSFLYKKQQQKVPIVTTNLKMYIRDFFSIQMSNVNHPMNCLVFVVYFVAILSIIFRRSVSSLTAAYFKIFILSHKCSFLGMFCRLLLCRIFYPWLCIHLPDSRNHKIYIL